MVRNLVFVTRYSKAFAYPKVTIYLNDKELGVLNIVTHLPDDLDRAEFLESAKKIIKKEYPQLTPEEIEVVRDFIVSPQ